MFRGGLNVRKRLIFPANAKIKRWQQLQCLHDMCFPQFLVLLDCDTRVIRLVKMSFIGPMVVLSKEDTVGLYYV